MLIKPEITFRDDKNIVFAKAPSSSTSHGEDIDPVEPDDDIWETWKIHFLVGLGFFAIILIAFIVLAVRHYRRKRRKHIEFTYDSVEQPSLHNASEEEYLIYDYTNNNSYKTYYFGFSFNNDSSGSGSSGPSVEDPSFEDRGIFYQPVQEHPINKTGKKKILLLED